MLPLLFGDFSDRPAFQGLVLSQMHVINERLIPAEHSHLTLLTVRTRARHQCRCFLHIALHGWTPSRVRQFGLALFEGADRGFVPRWQLVEETDGFQGEL